MSTPNDPCGIMEPVGPVQVPDEKIKPPEVCVVLMLKEMALAVIPCTLCTVLEKLRTVLAVPSKVR